MQIKTQRGFSFTQFQLAVLLEKDKYITVQLCLMMEKNSEETQVTSKQPDELLQPADFNKVNT